jgi:enterochelin esterase-like enzyme
MARAMPKAANVAWNMTMSGLYAEFVEKEVLPLVEKQYNMKLTRDPEGRATMGGSSGGSCALIMAWYHTVLYHRVLTLFGHLCEPAVAIERPDRSRSMGIS